MRRQALMYLWCTGLSDELVELSGLLGLVVVGVLHMVYLACEGLLVERMLRREVSHSAD